MIIFILQGLLGLLFTLLGCLTLSKNSFVTKNYNNLNLPSWFHYVIGCFQLAGGITVIVGIWIKWVALLSSGVLTLMMLVAVSLHLKKRDKMVGVLPALSVGIIAAIIFIFTI